MTQPTRGVVAAGNQKTAAAGIEMLQQGGNAFDAAVAAILASFVTESTLTSAAGGGFLLAHTQANEHILFDFFSQTPQSKQVNNLNFYPVEINFGDAVQEFHIGLGSMAVPGNIGGVFHVHQKLGRLPFHVVAEPAIHYASKGVEIQKFQYYSANILEPIISASSEMLQIYAPNGQMLAPGETLFMPYFADTLAYLTQKGVKEFYQGEIAHQLVKDCQEYGGYLTLSDLKNYQVIERKPLIVDYKQNTFLTNPPPSSGGILIAFALELLANVDFTNIEFGSTKHLQILQKVMQLTNIARKDRYNTNIYQQDIEKSFLSSEHINIYTQQLNKWGSTTHISVIDAEGNAASTTTSHGEGCGYVIPGTGIMMNNMLGEEDLNPHGFHQWQEDVRISSMMSPTIVLKNNQPEIVLGSGGSNRIRTAILQVISNIIDFKMPVDMAVNSPRIHWENNVLNVEPGFDVQPELLIGERTILWNQQNMFFGGVHTAMEFDGVITGAGDRRRNGAIASL
ncbi:gamma-glutamyltransferase [Aliterella atlantica]|uniref:Glutathione hydrolase proenzyme n=1 Tax=Aliterella atlantica CENA595 TaxID=1618023 RepID=A0A0D8ZRD4_9CYAN|nr:gamma-glutamyltransferase [Aliterella atlantica]KJH71280.1 gamma-glutamyltranspeptidase [Aliterella atlantica CENA595]